MPGEENETTNAKAYREAMKRFDDLVRRGLIEERGNALLPIEKRHRPAIGRGGNNKGRGRQRQVFPG